MFKFIRQKNRDTGCFEACLASCLGVEQDDIQVFYSHKDDEEQWIASLNAWLREKYGVILIALHYDSVKNLYLDAIGVVMTSINSNSETGRHCVLSDRGRVIFDPIAGELNRPISNTDEATIWVIHKCAY